MSRANTIDLLNELLTIEYRSLPTYLADADPWRREGDDRGASTLQDIVSDQLAMSARIVELLQDLDGAPSPGGYPMDFTDTHFLSLDFLLHRLIERQLQDISAIETIVPRFGADRAARELAEETLGAEKAHLEALESLVEQPA